MLAIPNYSATLAVIQSDQEEAFIMRYIHGHSWLFMTLKAPGQIPKTWDNGESVRYLNFKSDKPSSDESKMCVYINGGQDDGENSNHGLWLNGACDKGPDGSGGKYYQICMKPAVKGPILPDGENPTVPPNNHCDFGWQHLVETDNCYLLSKDVKSWQASEQYCTSFGGHLASVNSPATQQALVALSRLDASALGKIA